MFIFRGSETCQSPRHRQEKPIKHISSKWLSLTFCALWIHQNEKKKCYNQYSNWANLLWRLSTEKYIISIQLWFILWLLIGYRRYFNSYPNPIAYFHNQNISQITFKKYKHATLFMYPKRKSIYVPYIIFIRKKEKLLFQQCI